MQLLLTGATGLVGSGVLHHILSLSPTIASTKQLNRTSILSRNPEIPLLRNAQRPDSNTFTTIDVISHSDFTTYPDSLLSQLKAHALPHEDLAVIWALGMSQTDAKSPEQYTEVTKTFAVNAARALAKSWAPRKVVFVYVSGEGATKSPGLLTPLFGRVKGETEQELLDLMKQPDLSTLRVYNARPAAVDPGNQPAVNDWWVNEKLVNAGIATRCLLKGIMLFYRKGLWDSMHSPTEELGKVLLELGISTGEPLEALGNDVQDGGRTILNPGLRKLGAQHK